MPLSFLLDEHLGGPLWQAILRHNLGGVNTLDVVRVGDHPALPLSSDDSEILLWCEREGRILITEDRHTMAGHLRSHLANGRHSPGILILRMRQSIPDVVDSLVLIAHAGEPNEFADAISYFP